MRQVTACQAPAGVAFAAGAASRRHRPRRRRCGRSFGTTTPGHVWPHRCSRREPLDELPRRAYVPDRPDCAACGLPVTARQAKGKRSRREFDCDRCERTRCGSWLTSRLPGYLTPDEREDAAHSILLDILAGDLRPRDLTPHTLRRYVAQARGMTSDRFKFIR
jgi:hypothetical protein